MSHDRSEDWEDGEPPFGKRHGKPYYAEHMNTLAQRGDASEPSGVGLIYRLGEPTEKPPVLITPATRREIERVWAAIPRWDDLVPRRLRNRPNYVLREKSNG